MPFYPVPFSSSRVGTEILAGVATGGVARAAGAVGTGARVLTTLNQAAAVGRAGADIIENGASLQNVTQLVTGALNVGASAQGLRGAACASSTLGRLATTATAATNAVGMGVYGFDILANGLTAENAMGLFNSSLGTASLLFRSCFAAGTPILTSQEGAAKFIEEIRAGDLILSRDESNPEGPLALKLVEELFVRLAPVMDLRVRGKMIRTTAEHPFFVREAWAFVAARELTVGDLFLSHDGQWVAVEEMIDNGHYETVYNFRVADYHTYFVGDSSWGFSVWAHNTGADGCGVLGNGVRDRGRRLGQEQGREFRTDQLALQQYDPNAPRSVRGWLQNEQRRIDLGQATEPRTPPGYVMAHGRNTPAREGFDYSNSRLQSADLNVLEEAVRRRQGVP